MTLWQFSSIKKSPSKIGRMSPGEPNLSRIASARSAFNAWIQNETMDDFEELKEEMDTIWEAEDEHLKED